MATLRSSGMLPDRLTTWGTPGSSILPQRQDLPVSEPDNPVVHLREWRETLQLTQDALAERVGVSKSAISRWERGLRDMDTDQIVSCAKALGVEPLALFRSPQNHDAAMTIERFARLVDRIGHERANKLLDALSDTL